MPSQPLILVFLLSQDQKIISLKTNFSIAEIAFDSGSNSEVLSSEPFGFAVLTALI